MAKTIKLFTGKVELINVKDLRNIAQRAVYTAGVMNGIRVKYPFEHGLQIDVEYTDIKALFNYAMAFGVLMNEINPGALVDNKKAIECKFFCCANCLKVGKEHQNKLIRNYCNECAKVTEENRIKLLNQKQQTRDEETEKLRLRFSEPEEIKVIEAKPKVKLINPVKLKFKK